MTRGCAGRGNRAAARGLGLPPAYNSPRAGLATTSASSRQVGANRAWTPPDHADRPHLPSPSKRCTATCAPRVSTDPTSHSRGSASSDARPTTQPSVDSDEPSSSPAGWRRRQSTQTSSACGHREQSLLHSSPSVHVGQRPRGPQQPGATGPRAGFGRGRSLESAGHLLSGVGFRTPAGRAPQARVSSSPRGNRRSILGPGSRTCNATPMNARQGSRISRGR